MNAISTTLSRQNSKAIPAILTAGLVAGTMDMTAACIQAYYRSGTTPTQVMRFIASGLLGPTATTGGAKMAVLGTVLHYFIATTWAAVFYLASRKIRFLVAQPIISGLVYGVMVYSFMAFVVVPLSLVRRSGTPIPITARIVPCLIIMFFIGMPIALLIRRFTRLA